MALLAAATPRADPPRLELKAQARLRSDLQFEEKVKEHNLLDWNTTSVRSMRDTHEWLVRQIRESGELRLEFEEGTRGIVTSAGGEYLPVLLVSLRMLRRTGSTLPVEVFLKDRGEYEEVACGVLFRELGATCHILSELMGDVGSEFEIDNYQLKALAMLFSSFEKLLFLDADNFPVSAPEPILSSHVFEENGLVLWPDYWTPTVSPYFDFVTGLENGVLSDRPTIEAGQILVDKRRHASTLALAGYYNVFGDKYFYKLLTQGGPGEGDKDTFAAAALVLNVSFYTVFEPPNPLGIRNEGAAVLQYEPETDWEINVNGTGARPKIMFVHASWPPKLNAMRNYRQVRQWGREEKNRKLFGEDLEAYVWGLMVEMACDDRVQFKDWGDKSKGQKDEAVGVCEQTRESFRWMFGWVYGSQPVDEKEKTGKSS